MKRLFIILAAAVVAVGEVAKARRKNALCFREIAEDIACSAEERRKVNSLRANSVK